MMLTFHCIEFLEISPLAQTNPPPIRGIPQELATFLRQLWLRTGGASDSIQDSSSAIDELQTSAPDMAGKGIEQLIKRQDALEKTNGHLTYKVKQMEQTLKAFKAEIISG